MQTIFMSHQSDKVKRETYSLENAGWWYRVFCRDALGSQVIPWYMMHRFFLSLLGFHLRFPL